MKGLVKWVNHKKGYGFIYGTGSVVQDGEENVLPEYFVHFSQIKGKKITNYDMVEFEPHIDKKGMSALNVSVTKYTAEDDPRCYIAQKIFDEFNVEIPCLAWMNILFEDMRDIYNYFRAEQGNNTIEMKRIMDKYELEKVPKDEHASCIAAGGYELWKLDKEQMKKDGYLEA